MVEQRQEGAAADVPLQVESLMPAVAHANDPEATVSTARTTDLETNTSSLPRQQEYQEQQGQNKNHQDEYRINDHAGGKIRNNHPVDDGSIATTTAASTLSSSSSLLSSSPPPSMRSLLDLRQQKLGMRISSAATISTTSTTIPASTTATSVVVAATTTGSDHPAASSDGGHKNDSSASISSSSLRSTSSATGGPNITSKTMYHGTFNTTKSRNFLGTDRRSDDEIAILSLAPAFSAVHSNSSNITTYHSNKSNHSNQTGKQLKAVSTTTESRFEPDIQHVDGIMIESVDKKNMINSPSTEKSNTMQQHRLELSEAMSMSISDGDTTEIPSADKLHYQEEREQGNNKSIWNNLDEEYDDAAVPPARPGLRITDNVVVGAQFIPGPDFNNDQNQDYEDDDDHNDDPSAANALMRGGEVQVGEERPSNSSLFARENRSVDNDEDDGDGDDDDDADKIPVAFAISARLVTSDERENELALEEVRRLRQLVDSAVQAQSVTIDGGGGGGGDKNNDDDDDDHGSGRDGAKSSSNGGTKTRMYLCVVLLLVAVAAIVVGVVLSSSQHNNGTSSDNTSPAIATLVPTLSPIFNPTVSMQPVEPTARPSSTAPSLVPSMVPTVVDGLNHRLYCLDDPPTDAVTCNGIVNDTFLPNEIPMCFQELAGLELEYVGMNCSPTYDNNSTCQDYNGGPPSENRVQSYIVVTDAEEEVAFFEGWVGVGVYFSFDDLNRGFGLYQRIAIYDSNITTPDHLLQVTVYPSWICWEYTAVQGATYGSFIILDRTVRNLTGTIYDIESKFPNSTVTMSFSANITNTWDAHGPGTIQTLYTVTSFDKYSDLIDQVAVNNRTLNVGDSRIIPVASVTSAIGGRWDVRHDALVYADAKSPDGSVCSDSQDLMVAWLYDNGGILVPPTEAPTEALTGVPTAGPTLCDLQVEVECQVKQLCGTYDPGPVQTG